MEGRELGMQMKVCVRKVRILKEFI